MRPSAPQTGSNMVEEQLQSALHEASSTSLSELMELYNYIERVDNYSIHAQGKQKYIQ